MFIAILFLIIVVSILSGLRIVKQQSVGIVETFGKFQKLVHPGINFIMPFGISKIAHTADLRIVEYTKELEIKTKDNTFVALPVTLMLRVNPDKISESYYSLDNPLQQISSWVLNTVRSIAAGMNLNDLFEDKEEIVQKVKNEIYTKAESYGYILETVLIQQPVVSDEIQKASEKVVAALRLQEAATREGEAARIKIVAQATAEKEAQIARAQGVAASREILIQGLKRNIEEVKSAGADITDVMELLMTISKYDVMRDVGASGNMVVIDASGVELKKSTEQAALNSAIKSLSDKHHKE